MTKFAGTVIAVILGLVAIGTVGPGIASVIKALVVLVLVIGVIAGVLRVVWWRTRNW